MIVPAVLLGLFCAACDPEEGLQQCSDDSQCDDEVFCNGEETCFPGGPGADLFGCVPGVACRDRGPFARCIERLESCTYFDTGNCGGDADCQDGLYCNGYERCIPSAPHADDRGCIPGIDPCESDEECIEEDMTCEPPCVDADGDGSEALFCGGDDCDDADASRYPGNTEICDAVGHDEDCDPTTFGSRDEDGDGFIDWNCVGPEGGGRDCDDGNGAINPDVPEVCNGIDEDCDRDIDEGVSQMVYPDADFDGYGAAGAEAEQRCPQPGYSTVDTDCDDENPYLMPGGIRCTDVGQGNDMEVCQDGEWVAGLCDDGNTFRTCEAQPTGLGVCIP
ncbi:MAG: putative metal-binding motif-containing protein [Myxococcales bacterium]|jgi:hypothetical protein